MKIDFIRIEQKFRDYAALCETYAAANPNDRAYWLQQAADWWRQAEQVKEDENAILTSLALLARVNKTHTSE